MVGLARQLTKPKRCRSKLKVILDVMGAMVKAAKDHLASLRTAESLGVLGFSMGADWAVMTAANEPMLRRPFCFMAITARFQHDEQNA
jgi:dienelactone hydrolase